MKEVVLIGWMALAIEARADGPEVLAPALSIRVYNLAGIPQSDLEKMDHQAVKIFSFAGIRLSWSVGDPKASEAHLLDMSAPMSEPAPPVPRTLVLRIVPQADASYPPEVLGRALPWAQRGAHVTLFLNHIKKVQQQHEIAISLLCAYALAHEVAHVLLRSASNVHAAQGLMRAEWGPAEYDRIAHEALKFTPQLAAAMRAVLR